MGLISASYISEFTCELHVNKYFDTLIGMIPNYNYILK